MDNFASRKGFTMLDPDTFHLTVAARLDALDHPRQFVALAVEAVGLRSVLDSVAELTDSLAALLDGVDPELAVPIREVLEAVRERVEVGMVTVADIVGRMVR